MKANMDFINFQNGVAEGEVAQQMMINGNLNVGAMRPWIAQNGSMWITTYNGGDPKKVESYNNLQVNAGTLRRDEWKQLDSAIVETGRSRMRGVNDLISRGLTMSLGNAMGTTVLEWHDVNDSMEASLTMDGVSKSRGDRPVYQFNYLPIPIIHVDYEINARALEASRSLGNPLDTTSAEHAADKVARKLESMLFTNTTYAFGETDDRSRNTIYSYINHPDRNTVTLSTYGDWASESATTPAEIYESVRAMKAAAIADYQYGPFKLYVPGNFESRLDDDYSTSGTSVLTIRERIMKLDGIEEVAVSDYLPDSNVALVQMQKETVRLVQGIGLTNVQWATEGNFVNKFKVFTIQVPQIRSDQSSQCGIVHMS